MLEGPPPDADDPNLAAPQESDRLERITAMLRRARDLKLLAEDLETRRKAANAELSDLTMRQLPELFMQAHASSVGLPPEGNQPGYEARLKPYYKAVISTEWPPEKQHNGYAVLREIGGADLVRSTVVVEFGKGQDHMANQLIKWLMDVGIPYTRGEAVHWGTLTAWLREQYTKLRREFTLDQLDAIGATVGHVVEVKQVKT
jgi:hypothetical protein